MMTLRIFDRPKSRDSRPGSPILPTKNQSPLCSTGSVGFPKRYTRMGVLAIIALSAFLFFYGFEKTEEIINNMRHPPLYERYHEYEDNLPQHNPDLPYPEGRDAKFFWASNHVTHSGWGNAMQELLVNAHLAYVTKRSFVFDNFTWERGTSEYSNYYGKLIPARVPLSSMISGPLIGGPFEAGDDAPRAVSRKYYEKMCPKSKRVIIDSEAVNDETIRYSKTIGASYMFDRWVEKLNSIEDQCVEILQDSYQLFEIWVFGSRRILDIWPRLSQSPLLKNFSWSPLIRSAFKANLHLFRPFSWFSYLFSKAEEVAIPPDESDAPYPGLLVLHIRRGDFKEHCTHLANWSSDWNGFNSFPEFIDKFSPPSGGGWGVTTPENTALYLKHCYPTIEQIVEKVTEVQKMSDGLKNVYIMTNGGTLWVDELRKALKKAHGWNQIASSSDLRLNREQKYVAQTVDMMIGQRAQVFIGNGFSSLTSNIIMLRMAKGVPPETNRFW